MKTTKHNVLFLGDVNIDISFSGLETPIVTDCEVFCANFSKTLGGSTCLASAVFARLGGNAGLCGLIGEDENGRFIKNELSQLRIDTSLLQSRKKISTGVTVNLIYGRERSQVTYRGALSAFNNVSHALKALNRFSHVHISGPYGMPSFFPHIDKLLQSIKKEGKTVSIDTQWDPSEQWMYLDSWLAKTDYFFINKNEALSITKTRDIQKAYAILVSKTPMPIIKLGNGGVIVENKIYPAYDVPVVDTTGAGDAFAAGFLFAVIQLNLPYSEAARFASAAAAIACTYTGNNNKKMNMKAVKELYTKKLEAHPIEVKCK
ncbi:carbohydrate kinase family protein [Treponema sp. HNW]|uniref:carbohydrate kinase family protein n=1 Tax=Treponema sp. HNW TaxID=3116654 RepID=UPI003D0EEF49